MTQPVLNIRGLCKRFPVGKGRFVNAVNNVNLTIAPGETLGMVGESGSGKSTLGRVILRLSEPTEGSIEFNGQDITKLPKGQVRPLRRDMQMVFQDPWSALNPRMRIRDLIAEPIKLHMPMSRSEREDRTETLARRVNLSTALLNRTPANLSGGQLQRVCIARAIATNPKLIVLDEPTSSLDLSVRAGILELLAELRTETQAAMLFISHDLGTVRMISHRIAVLYLGEVVEQGAAEALFETPSHPYTQALLSAHLPADPAIKVTRHVLEGEVPSPIALPSGCKFHTRCPVAIDRCRSEAPPVLQVPTGQEARCLRIPDGGNKLQQKEIA
ncbi:ABC transporter ATP-binding protein [Puniceibacterium sp. IMCC21224]|uniref:ABC transporter ATP-binding protein n=1 Tax=Puniceibacterium sp. IMCC21224 TaxID=1618204 RepID=UPI00064DE5BB|nr:ABC transporter ATP-binding protein [Puniceibacterium sp. IMCC21224]KMK64898.1 oligopeptide/dipeptide ABC transporter, ATP-binding protein [Puniceibacterium sp. IMCC21224]